MLMGRVGKEPDYYSSEKGSCLVMALATNYVYKKKDGEYETITDWHTIKMFGKKADALKTVFKKGDVVFATGRITRESYKDKNGIERTVPVILGEELNVIERFKAKENNSEDPQQQQTKGEEVNTKSKEDEDDDLPF
jgi:single-strand DNA-binding protein